MSARRKILANLEGRVNPINEMCTFSGLEVKEAQDAIGEMLREGIVVVEFHLGMPLYKLSWKGRDLANSKLRVVS